MSHVGAGIGDSFEHTTEVKLMKCIEVTKTKDIPRWKKAIKEEHGNFPRCEAVKTVPKDEVPGDASIIGSSWARRSPRVHTGQG